MKEIMLGSSTNWSEEESTSKLYVTGQKPTSSGLKIVIGSTQIQGQYFQKLLKHRDKYHRWTQTSAKMNFTFSEQMNRSAVEALADFVNLSLTNFSFTTTLENTTKFQIKSVFSKTSKSTALNRRLTSKISSLSPIMSKEVSRIYLKICVVKMQHGS